jgi:nitrogen regulatory protein P-II 1
MLQLVTAVIQPHRLETVKEALKEAGVAGMTVTEASGFGRQGARSETYRGAEYQVEFIPKVKIEILCSDEDADRIADVIASAAGSGEIGDGKIWVAPVSRAIRIRTGEVGRAAV